MQLFETRKTCAFFILLFSFVTLWNVSSHLRFVYIYLHFLTHGKSKARRQEPTWAMSCVNVSVRARQRLRKNSQVFCTDLIFYLLEECLRLVSRSKCSFFWKFLNVFVQILFRCFVFVFILCSFYCVSKSWMSKGSKKKFKSINLSPFLWSWNFNKKISSAMIK